MSLAAFYDVPAPAKLNLFLHVTGRRADGYHLLQSVFVLIDWCDTLHFERRADGALARHDLGAAAARRRSVLRAARALQAASGTRCGADIAIDKRMPARAGLGGGSSRRGQLPARAEPPVGPGLAARAAAGARRSALGADVPFFLGGRNAWVEGIGERLTPVDAAAAALRRA